MDEINSQDLVREGGLRTASKESSSDTAEVAGITVGHEIALADSDFNEQHLLNPSLRLKVELLKQKSAERSEHLSREIALLQSSAIDLAAGEPTDVRAWASDKVLRVVGKIKDMCECDGGKFLLNDLYFEDAKKAFRACKTIIDYISAGSFSAPSPSDSRDTLTRVQDTFDVVASKFNRALVFNRPEAYNDALPIDEIARLESKKGAVKQELAWSKELASLAQEYKTRLAALPLAGESSEQLRSRIDASVSADPYELPRLYLDFIRDLEANPELSDLADYMKGLGLKMRAFEVSANDTDSQSFLSPPGKVMRRHAPEGYTGREQGFYDFVHDAIIIWKDRVRLTSGFDTVIGEAASAKLTDEDELVMHEAVHGLQGRARRNDGASDWPESNLGVALYEAQAFMGSTDFFDPPALKKFVEILQQNYKVPGKESEYAVSVIARLQALGVDEKDSERIFRESADNWDEKKGVCTNIEERIAEVKKAKGIPDGADMSIAYKIHCMERRIIGLKYAQEARNLIAKLSGQSK